MVNQAHLIGGPVSQAALEVVVAPAILVAAADRGAPLVAVGALQLGASAQSLRDVLKRPVTLLVHLRGPECAAEKTFLQFYRSR